MSNQYERERKTNQTNQIGFQDDLHLETNQNQTVQKDLFPKR